MEKTLKEHLTEISRARWERTSTEDKKAHAIKMAQARWKGHTKTTRGKNDKKIQPTYGANGNDLAVGGNTETTEG